jgi:hypothetical protein
MKSFETTVRMVTACALTSITLAAVIVALGAGNGDDGRPMAKKPLSVEGYISRVRVIAFDETVAIFDSTTGAIAKYNGDLTNASCRGTWRPHVNGVKGTSGMLEIQRPQGPGTILPTPGTGVTNQVVFLVDIVTGKTWQLNRRGTNATWDAVDIVG